MNKKELTRILVLAVMTVFGTVLNQDYVQAQVELHVAWNDNNVKGEVEVSHGKLTSLSIPKGKGSSNGSRFNVSDKGVKLKLFIDEANTKYGPNPTVVHIKSDKSSFSFFLRDVNQDFPIYIPEYAVVVSTASDTRSYLEVERDILLQKSKTKIQRIEAEGEMSFIEASRTTRNMSVPIWLGISRDMRTFEVSEELEDNRQEGKIIRPRYATSAVKIPGNTEQAYIYVLGRGVGVKNNIKRRLEEGVMPIYHSTMQDDDVNYHTVSFVSFAELPLTKTNNKGTNYVVSDKHSSGRRFKDEHIKELEERMSTAYDFDDAMVFYSRTTIKNTGEVPRYAWIKVPRPGTGWGHNNSHSYDNNTGYSTLEGNQVFCISTLNGEVMANEEIAILLQPGETAEYDFFLPHTPISLEKANVLKKQRIDMKLEEAKSYWKEKLASVATISLPEKRIQEMIQAGLLHLDLITFGDAKDDIVSANIGVYSPIGTESSPIIQFYLSMGWHDLAKKSLNYFLATQLESGYIQNYEGYTIETGAALWTMGEYIRYTKDFDWLKSTKHKILKSCDYLIEWRNKNKKEELRGRGYGMIDGQVADPVDNYRQFMLNGYAYLGLSRIAEALKDLDPAQSQRLLDEATAWKIDILETVKTLFALSPVVPLGDGRWVPTIPPWAEADGLRALFQKEEIYWSHGTFTAADAMLGPLYLVFCEVIAPESEQAKMLLDYHSELFYQENSVFSQPYYSRHNWLQAKLGMTKPFLSTYYNTFSAHADRDTYTFWEHMYRVSPHKTHEEAWFLMETRWMLYMEEGDQLSIFKTIPRDWLKDGEVIELNNVKSYFGNLKLKASSHVNSGTIDAVIELEAGRKPSKVTIRLPHPDNLYPKKVTGGVYDRETETITIDAVANKLNVKVEF